MMMQRISPGYGRFPQLRLILSDPRLRLIFPQPRLRLIC
jgi:hypothetical protein